MTFMATDHGDHTPGVRPARADDLALLPTIEAEADRLFDDVGVGPLPAAAGMDELVTAHCVLVAGRPPVGFARLEIVDDHAHLEQLSVHPSHGRRGVGTELLAASCRWAADNGHAVMTLSTFADIAWNAPFYARHGFVPVPDDQLTPGLRALRRRETELGLDALGRRTIMARSLQTRIPVPTDAAVPIRPTGR
jgi:GNAT superfamily N-acetyltransferase